MAEVNDNVPGAMTTQNTHITNTPEVAGKRKVVGPSNPGETHGRQAQYNVPKEHIAAEIAKNKEADFIAKGGAPSPFKP